MKLLARVLTLGLVAGLNSQFATGETLRLKLEPDRTYLLKGSPEEVVIKIDLSAISHQRHFKRAPLNLAVVLDRSGSMTGAKIEKARQAAMALVDQLGRGDIFSLITYSDHAEVVVPASEIDDKERLKSRISRVQPGGSTALYAGVQLGADELQRFLSGRKINRVILLSDGLANRGPSTPRDLRQLGRSLSERGIAVTTIGVGDDYNEDLMAGLAEASDANYYYVQDTEKLPQIFAKELGQLMRVAARGVKIEITCPEGVRPMGFIGRPEQFRGQTASVQFNEIALGQDRYVFLRCQRESERSSAELARIQVSYMDELNEGKQQSISEIARIGLTDDAQLAAKSLRNDVTAQKELMLAAVAKDEALADADAGRYQQAAQKLSTQATLLDRRYQTAPTALQPQIRQEVENLKARSHQLEQNRYDAGTRKALQCESWNYRNAKQIEP